MKKSPKEKYKHNKWYQQYRQEIAHFQSVLRMLREEGWTLREMSMHTEIPTQTLSRFIITKRLNVYISPENFLKMTELCDRFKHGTVSRG